MTGCVPSGWWLRFFGLCVLMIAFSTSGAEAQISIDIDETQRISFESGGFDIRKYSGKMQGFSYFVDDRLVMTADQIDLETAGRPKDGSFFVKSLQVINAEVTGQGIRFSNVIARNIDFGVLLERHQMANNVSYDAGGVSFSDDSFLQIKGTEVSGEAVDFGIGNIETLAFVFDELPTGERYAKNAGLLIDDLRFDLDFGPGQVKPEFKDFAELLLERGLRTAEFDLAVSQIAQMVDDELRAEHAVNLMMDDMASLELITGFEVKLGTIRALDAMAARGKVKESEILNLLGGVELVNLNVVYLDDGLLDTLVALTAAKSNLNPAVMRSNLQVMLTQTLAGILPRNGGRIAQPMANLLQQSGGLEVSMRPKRPVMLSNFLGFLIMPDLAIEQLGISVTHLRR